ncbi:hypothetical protein J6590_097788, partial [Homalodisca vitripennis]
GLLDSGTSQPLAGTAFCQSRPLGALSLLVLLAPCDICPCQLQPGPKLILITGKR